MDESTSREEAVAKLRRDATEAMWRDDIYASYGGVSVARSHPHTRRKVDGDLQVARDALDELVAAVRAAGAADARAGECVWTVIPYHEGSYLIAACEAQTAMPLDRRHTLCPCCGGKVRIEELADG